MRGWIGAACVAVSVTASSPALFAAEATRVVSGYWEGKRMDVNLTLGFVHEWKRAFVKRESAEAQSALIKDSVYKQQRDILLARLDFGLIHDLSLHVDFPIVLRDDRQLAFDQTATPCSFSGASPDCVNQDNSTILRDGILPGVGQPMYGVDAAHVDAANPTGRPFTEPSATVFRGPRRSGLEWLGLGAAWAIFNQRRDATKPTWTMGLDGRFDVASSMRYDAARPGANTGVGLGYHQLIASTFASRRFASFDPYLGLYYMHPVVPSGSLYAPLSVASQPYADPQRRVGVLFGFEHILWENPDAWQRVTLEGRGRAEHRFQGRSASELWEPLSGASTCPADVATCRRTPGSADPVGMDYDTNGGPSRFPGITETQGYSAVGGDAGLNVQVGRYARFRALFGFATELPHFITFGTAGRDTNGDGRVDSTDRAEANPTYREVIDLPGRRFKIEGTQLWTLFLDGSILF